MAEILQAIIDWLDWYMGTELPMDTLGAVSDILSKTGSVLYWLISRYIEVLGG